MKVDLADSSPIREPTALTAGDTWQWRRTVAGYSAADGWALTYYLEGPNTLTIVGVADGAGWVVTKAAADTAAVARGAYQLHGVVELAGVRHRIYRGGLRVARDPAALSPATARRSHAEEMYELIVARLEGRLPTDRESQAIDGTQITRIPIAELMRLRGYYAELLRQELYPEVSPIRSVVCRDAL